MEKSKDNEAMGGPTDYMVAIDNVGGAIKLVDRMEFSRANFSSDVIKGWQK